MNEQYPCQESMYQYGALLYMMEKPASVEELSDDPLYGPLISHYGIPEEVMLPLCNRTNYNGENLDNDIWFNRVFQNLEIVKDSDFLVEEFYFMELGWETFRFLICGSGQGTSCVLLVNRFDRRFCIGGGILGLSYGNSKKAQLSALAECLQTLEVYLFNRCIESSLKFYLQNPEGGKLLLGFLTVRKVSDVEIDLGDHYYSTTKTCMEIPCYTEYFIENPLPHQLNQKKTQRVPENLRSRIIDRGGIPLPIGKI